MHRKRMGLRILVEIEFQMAHAFTQNLLQQRLSRSLGIWITALPQGPVGVVGTEERNLIERQHACGIKAV